MSGASSRLNEAGSPLVDWATTAADERGVWTFGIAADATAAASWTRWVSRRSSLSSRTERAPSARVAVRAKPITSTTTAGVWSRRRCRCRTATSGGRWRVVADPEVWSPASVATVAPIECPRTSVPTRSGDRSAPRR